MVKHTRFGKIDDENIVVYTDSSYKNDEQKVKSAGETPTAAYNKEGDSGSGKSKTIQQTCKRIKTADTQSIEKGIEDVIYVARILKEAYDQKVSE